MKISREDVLKVAELAHLELSPEEVETYRGQLDSILNYIEKLKSLDVSRTEPMSQVIYNNPERSVAELTRGDGGDRQSHPELRDDVLQPCGTAADLFGQAPSAAKPFFRVPRVIER